MTDRSAPKVWLTTLGCAKNEVDSAKLSGVLGDAGYRNAPSAGEADVVMVNTCAFIEDARRESIDAIMELSAARSDGASLVVLGCMAQRYGNDLAAALPEADDVVGIDRYPELVDRLDRLTGWHPERPARPRMDILYEVRRPTPATPYAFVKIAEGCDKQCTFCAIPQFRGAQRSRSAVSIHGEVADLVAGGVGEIGLVAQDAAAYGRDIDAPGGIEDLVRFVAGVEGLRRLRLYYLYPREIRPGLIEEIAGNPIVASYFDLSLQHSAPDLLRAMKRPGSGESHLELIGRIRDAAPDAALRSSFIVGFPGESDEDVAGLAAFLEEARLDWAGFFPFSAEEGTPAASFARQLPSGEIMERLRYLQGIQDAVTAECNAAQIGRTFEVLIDLVEDGTPVGRSYREAPEIDGVIVLDRGEPGEWVQARVTGAYATDLVAEVA
jgi:ribosomal protein S12 methylthiotransferase RimO